MQLQYLSIGDLKGKILSDVKNTGDEIVFTTAALAWPMANPIRGTCEVFSNNSRRGGA